MIVFVWLLWAAFRAAHVVLVALWTALAWMVKTILRIWL